MEYKSGKHCSEMITHDGHAPTASFAASFAPCHRVWMCPYPPALGSKKKVSIEFVSRDWTTLQVLCIGVSASLASENHLEIYGAYYAKSGDWMIPS